MSDGGGGGGAACAGPGLAVALAGGCERLAPAAPAPLAPPGQQVRGKMKWMMHLRCLPCQTRRKRLVKTALTAKL